MTQTIDVPDFAKAPVVLSGIAIAAKSTIHTPTANPDPQLKDVLPGAPTAVRDFPRGDTLAIFAEVYDNQPSPSHRVSIASSIITDDGREMFAAADERSSDISFRCLAYALPLGLLSWAVILFCIAVSMGNLTV